MTIAPNQGEFSFLFLFLWLRTLQLGYNEGKACRFIGTQIQPGYNVNRVRTAAVALPS